jgi:hypothetical protein
VKELCSTANVQPNTNYFNLLQYFGSLITLYTFVTQSADKMFKLVVSFRCVVTE